MGDSSRPVTGYPAQANGYPQPNTAYAYPAPPHQQPPPYQYNPNPYYHAPPASNRRSNFIRGFLITAIAITIIFGTILLIFWLVVRPRLPDFHLDSLSVSNFSAANQTVSGRWDAGFQVKNGNKRMSIYYDDVFSSIFHKSDPLADTRMPPFKQGTRDLTTINASYSVTSFYIGDRVVNAINGERSGGTVKFNVKLTAVVGFKYGGWRTRNRMIRVSCKDVPVGVPASSGSGKLTGGARECSVD